MRNSNDDDDYKDRNNQNDDLKRVHFESFESLQWSSFLSSRRRYYVWFEKFDCDLSRNILRFEMINLNECS